MQGEKSARHLKGIAVLWCDGTLILRKSIAYASFETKFVSVTLRKGANTLQFKGKDGRQARSKRIPAAIYAAA